jgi:hypothetical protein
MATTKSIGVSACAFRSHRQMTSQNADLNRQGVVIGDAQPLR